MSLNPYEAPRLLADEERPPPQVIAQPFRWPYLLPLLAWTSLLFFGLPVLQHVTMFLSVFTSVLSLSIAAISVRAVTKPWHWGGMSLIWLLLAFIQSVCWSHALRL